MFSNYHNAYPHTVHPQFRSSSHYQNDERFGFIAPFILGGLAGGLIASRPRPIMPMPMPLPYYPTMPPVQPMPYTPYQYPYY